jgi:hypothetical protein
VSVYVDVLRVYPNAWGPFLRGSCHLFADHEDEAKLHEIAAAIGMKRSWFQPDRRGDCSHYDLVPSKRAAAVRLGAIEVDDRGAVAIWHANRAKARGVPAIYPCGCSHLKVAAGRCDAYAPDGRERAAAQKGGSK